MTRASPWWAKDVYADRKPFLKVRSLLGAAIRQFFAHERFVEVETAALQVSGGNETHISPFGVELIGQGGDKSRLYLHSSPEFACKKLLAAGEERIFTFAHVFRNRERTALHHPEFTMLEWYRAHEPVSRLIEDCADLLAVAAKAAGTDNFVWRDREAEAFEEPEILTVCEAFGRHANIDLAALLGDRDGLARAAARDGVSVAADDTWSDLFSKILCEKVEHRLGRGRATILTDYPVSEAALARPKPDDPRFAERFELYVCGVEIANGFGELTDPAEQRRRFVEAGAARARLYGEACPIDEDFLDALAVMPPASGIALGFDRLVMLAAGATRIEQVLWTPVAERGTVIGRSGRREGVAGMKIVVIGASRGIGLEVVKQALERGHEVTALLRDPAKLALEHARLHKVRGDVGKPDDVLMAMSGQDAVCTCVGVNPTREPVELFSRGARNVLAALQDAPTTKFVAVTGVGAGDSRGHGGFFYDKILQPLLLGTIYADKDREEQLIKASAADWLIVRPGSLTDGPRTKDYRAITDLSGVTAGKISRADVADFILNQLESRSLFKQTPLLTY